jgi:hypothetical protein
MRILTVDNQAFNMNNLPNEIDELYYGVLDYTTPSQVDYKFIPLLFLESFNSPSVDLKIGQYRIQMPIEWSLVIGDKNSGELEVIELKKLNDRPFQVFGINPISGFMPDFLNIEIVNVFPDVKWYFPKLKYGHLLAVPLDDRPKPVCAFFVKETSRIPEQLDISQMV